MNKHLIQFCVLFISLSCTHHQSSHANQFGDADTNHTDSQRSDWWDGSQIDVRHLCSRFGIKSRIEKKSSESLVQSINDVSHLNPISIACIIEPDSEELIQQIVKAVKLHNQQNPGKMLSISVMGTRHSQGGHIASSQGIVIDMTKLRHVDEPYLVNGGWVVSVQAGATWEDVHRKIKKTSGTSLSVKVQQSSAPFSIGGSLAVNCHGRNFSYGPVVHSVKSVKIVTPEGDLVTASRTQEKDLFNMAIGGYGLFGVIVEVELELLENHFLDVEIQTYNSISSYVTAMQRLIATESLGKITRDKNGAILREELSSIAYLFGIVDLSEKFFRQVSSYIYRYRPKVDLTGEINPDPVPSLSGIFQGEGVALVSEMGFKLNRHQKFLSLARSLQRKFLAKQNTRLKMLTPPIRPILAANTEDMPDLLQEYFIPLQNVPEFMKKAKTILKKNKVALTNASFRMIPKVDESGQTILHYEDTRYHSLALVLYFSIQNQPNEIKKARKWTNELVDLAISLEGRHYLPYQMWVDADKVRKAYPHLDQFTLLKRQRDPWLVFRNRFYDEYMSRESEAELLRKDF